MSVVMNTTDDKANFLVGTQGEICDFLIANKESTDLRNVDYDIPLKEPPKCKEDASTIFEAETKEEEEYEILSSKDFFDNVKIKSIDEPVKKKDEPLPKGVPVSFLKITNIEDGYKWYKYYYPKYPDEIIRIMCRSQWGKPLSKKVLKNEAKKQRKDEYKKECKRKGIKFNEKRYKKEPALKITNKPIIVSFQ